MVQKVADSKESSKGCVAMEDMGCCLRSWTFHLALSPIPKQCLL
jgi:hypothetical protein